MPNSLGFRGGISAKKRKTEGENSVRSGTNTAFRKADSRLEGAHLLFYQFRNSPSAIWKRLAGGEWAAFILCDAQYK